MITYPQALKFHKRTAQLQLDMNRPAEEVAENGKKRIKDGCLFLSLAKALGDDSGRMDWTNKLNMKLNGTDIVKILAGLNVKNFPIDLIHKSQKDGIDATSTLKIELGQTPGTFKVFLGRSFGEQKSYGTIYLNGEDMLYVKTMLEAALPVISGWVS